MTARERRLSRCARGRKISLYYIAVGIGVYCIETRKFINLSYFPYPITFAVSPSVPQMPIPPAVFWVFHLHPLQRNSDSQREESIEGQLRECKAFAEKNGITIFGTYIDRALSAKTDNRPQFQKMIQDSGKRLFDVVLVWKLDRFARNRYDSAQHKNTLKKNGVKVVSATEQIAEDSTGILIESILEGYAEYYSVELSEKVRRGQKENALKGKYNGGGMPMGFVKNSQQEYEIDPITAPVVLGAFKRYSNGELIRDICA